MLTLIGKKKAKPFIEIQEKLDKLAVSYRMKYTRDTPYIQDGSIIVKGKKEIKNYLEDLSEELRKWYYCSI